MSISVHSHCTPPHTGRVPYWRSSLCFFKHLLKQYKSLLTSEGRAYQSYSGGAGTIRSQSKAGRGALKSSGIARIVSLSLITPP